MAYVRATREQATANATNISGVATIDYAGIVGDVRAWQTIARSLNPQDRAGHNIAAFFAERAQETVGLARIALLAAQSGYADHADIQHEQQAIAARFALARFVGSALIFGGHREGKFLIDYSERGNPPAHKVIVPPAYLQSPAMADTEPWDGNERWYYNPLTNIYVRASSPAQPSSEFVGDLSSPVALGSKQAALAFIDAEHAVQLEPFASNQQTDAQLV